MWSNGPCRLPVRWAHPRRVPQGKRRPHRRAGPLCQARPDARSTPKPHAREGLSTQIRRNETPAFTKPQPRRQRRCRPGALLLHASRPMKRKPRSRGRLGDKGEASAAVDESAEIVPKQACPNAWIRVSWLLLRRKGAVRRAPSGACCSSRLIASRGVVGAVAPRPHCESAVPGERQTHRPLLVRRRAPPRGSGERPPGPRGRGTTSQPP
jgi:hypothetical protein